MAAITTCRNWTAMHNSAPVGPPWRSRAIRWSLFEMRCSTPVCHRATTPTTSSTIRPTGRSHLRVTMPNLSEPTGARSSWRCDVLHPGRRLADHGAGGPQVAQPPRQLAVAQRRPVRDGAQGVPYAPLKRRPDGAQGQIEGRACAGEILLELSSSLREQRARRAATVVLHPVLPLE